ncbi:MAG: putative N-acetylmannosamine-6-phosphate 2-epimerase [Bryobacteraceae bacterium]|jgi:glucokinase
MSLPGNCRGLRGKLIVSCQAASGDAFYGAGLMARFAQAAVAGGAAGIRANGPEDISEIRQATAAVPIIGIQKSVHPDGRTLITASFESARALVEAGASMVALDCTARGQRYGAFDRVRRIREELGVPVLADIATLDEALASADAGADMVLPTLRGYTPDTEEVMAFDPRFIEGLVRRLGVPVIAEGRIISPVQAREAIAAGAFAVVVGTAISRPKEITGLFATAVEREFRRQTREAYFVGVDLGGTNTKFGVVSSAGTLVFDSFVPTPAGGGREALLDNVKRAIREARKRATELGIGVEAAGIATAGWVDARSGRIAYATDNLPGWTGTPVAEEVSADCGLPVVVENDANALAVAEGRFGAAREWTDFVCITLGTGVGSGCYVGGALHRGAHFFANALGHLVLIPDGIPCNCGQRGCLEVYCNAAALVRYAGAAFPSAADVIDAANAGHAAAAAAVRTLGGHLAQGCAALVQLLDPQGIVLSGGLAVNNPQLLAAVGERLPSLVSVWDRRGLSVVSSGLGYFGGVLGAAALACGRWR